MCAQVEEYEEEAVLRSGCKEYFWLLCKLIDNIHVKDASQTTLLDLDALARHLADCIRRYFILSRVCFRVALLTANLSVFLSFLLPPQPRDPGSAGRGRGGRRFNGAAAFSYQCAQAQACV